LQAEYYNDHISSKLLHTGGPIIPSIISCDGEKVESLRASFYFWFRHKVYHKVDFWLRPWILGKTRTMPLTGGGTK
jgi:hypothetical protein